MPNFVVFSCPTLQTQRNKSSVFEDEDAEGPPSPPSSLVPAQSDAGDAEEVFESNETATSEQVNSEEPLSPTTPRVSRTHTGEEPSTPLG